MKLFFNRSVIAFLDINFLLLITLEERIASSRVSIAFLASPPQPFDNIFITSSSIIMSESEKNSSLFLIVLFKIILIDSSL